MNVLKSMLFEFGRWSIIQGRILGIGKIVEEEDKFICIVNQKKFNRQRRLSRLLNLRGLWRNDEEGKRIMKFFRLNKPVYYIFDGIKFEDSLEFAGHVNTYVIFKNCEFKHSIRIFVADNVIFENNKYCDRAPRYRYSNTFLSNKIKIDNLKLLNENFMNFDDGHHPTFFGMNLEVGNLEIVDSKIGIINNVTFKGKEMFPNRGGLIIRADKIKIINSSVDVAEVYLDSKSIEIDDRSTMKASQGMIIENELFDIETSNIETPYLVYNGVEFINKNEVSIDKDSVALQRARANWARTMSCVLDKCVSTNEKQIDEIKANLNSKSLKKVLKR